jgi:isocitrate/isopropylmalate dehydrogenase
MEAYNPRFHRRRKTMAAKIPVTLIPGDGIGPEVTEATLAILEAVGAPFEWEEHKAGMAGLAAAGDPLPKATVESIRKTRLALKGPLATPVGGGFRSSNVRLREEFQLYANLRPARTLIPGGRYEKIDIVLVRENLEGLYVGFEHYIPIGDDPHAVSIGSGVNTRAGGERINRFAFDYAVKNNRKKVTLVHKANVLKALTGLFLETGRHVAKQLRRLVRALRDFGMDRVLVGKVREHVNYEDAPIVNEADRAAHEHEVACRKASPARRDASRNALLPDDRSRLVADPRVTAG